MRGRMIVTGLVAGLSLTGPAMAQQNATPGSAGAQPDRGRQNQGTGLFPKNQPVPMYSTDANNAGVSLQTPGRQEPNAGSTGLTGSGSNSYGWSAPAYSSQAQRRP